MADIKSDNDSAASDVSESPELSAIKTGPCCGIPSCGPTRDPTEKPVLYSICEATVKVT